MYIDRKPKSPADLSESLDISSLFAHASQLVEDGNGVALCQQVLLVVEEDGHCISEENLAAFIEEGIPDTHHCLVENTAYL